MRLAGCFAVSGEYDRVGTCPLNFLGTCREKNATGSVSTVDGASSGYRVTTHVCTMSGGVCRL